MINGFVAFANFRTVNRLYNVLQRFQKYFFIPNRIDSGEDESSFQKDNISNRKNTLSISNNIGQGHKKYMNFIFMLIVKRILNIGKMKGVK